MYYIKKFLFRLLKVFQKSSAQESPIEMAQKGVNVRFMGENVIDNVNPHLVKIGNNCVIGVRSSILTHCPIKGGQEAVIGDYVWLGFNVLVLPGAVIGNNSIVGAGSVVTKKFPDNVVLAGNPAKVVRSLSDDEVQQLQYRLSNRLAMGKVRYD